MRAWMPAICLALLLVGLAPAQDSLNVSHVGGCVIGPLTVHAVGVVVNGDYAYVACWVEPPDTVRGLHVISVADPTQPVEVGYCLTPGQARGVAVAGDYAYVADYDSGLSVISIADPLHPVEIGHVDLRGRSLGVAVAGGYAYVVDNDSGGLHVISIADPAHPAPVGYCASPATAAGVAVRGTYAYVAGSGLSVISVADPAHPVEVGNCQTCTPGGVAVSGYYAYTTALLNVTRVADPAHPVEVWSTGGDGWGVAVASDRAYVAADMSGLRVYTLADPGSPAWIGYYRLPGNPACGVTVAGDYVYVAYDRGGLQIFQYYGPGVEESPRPQATSHKFPATVVRSLPQGAVAFDAMGRRVANPRSGIFFVRERSTVGGERSAVTKVIVSR